MSSAQKKTAVFRADASQSIGGGHLVRCLALSGALSKSGWSCAFAYRDGTVETVPALRNDGYDLLPLDCEESQEPSALLSEWPNGVDLLVADHYGRDSAFESTCRPWARRIMVIDDMANRPHDCDLLLDQTLGRRDSDYKSLVPDGCGFLLGPSFALLRPEFAKLRSTALAQRGEGRPVKRVLVSMGAADPHNVSAIVLDGIGRSGLDAEVDVVAGAASPHLNALRSLAQSLPFPVTVHETVNNMAGLMARADLAIGAAGSTSWERCCLGLPCLTVVMADNQEKIAAELARASAILFLGRWGDVTPEGVARELRTLDGKKEGRLRRIGAQASEICDGRGTDRVLIALVQPLSADDGGPVRLRMADRTDRDRILAWQRDQRTREFARDPEPPTAREHAKWFARSLLDMDRFLMVIEHGCEPAGILRLDRLECPDTYEVSIFVAPEKYRLGIASAALSLARALIPNATLHATILSGNDASHRLFQSAGYHLLRESLYVSKPDGQGAAE